MIEKVSFFDSLSSDLHLNPGFSGFQTLRKRKPETKAGRTDSPLPAAASYAGAFAFLISRHGRTIAGTLS